ncbi:hypothetical protein CMI47_14125 [Candidatus Pacearchaeota archaeon]|jgi:hypothetical protein|nr:hypothetical protein [Candidatus Pacearchaeota archaeon]|tara:strand:+ start:1067 stop:1351 length:285 start_codon:yes stop_codon:yes gene_type:complete
MNHDWVSIIAIGLMMSAVSVVVIIYYQSLQQECVSNPLVYAAQTYEDAYGYDVHGTLNLITPGNIIAPTIYFNSKEVSSESFDESPINITDLQW